MNYSRILLLLVFFVYACTLQVVAQPKEMQWTPDALTRPVVLIGDEIKTPDGQRSFVPKGTGFFVANPSSNYRPLLITCRHLLENRRYVWVRFNSRDGMGVVLDSVSLLENNSQTWTSYPDNLVDLAAVPVLGRKDREDPGVFDSVMITPQGIVREGDEVLFVGFPMSGYLSGITKNQPTIGEDIVSEVLQKHLVLTDTQLVPRAMAPRGTILLQGNVAMGGNSGSPVFLKKNGALIGVVSGAVIIGNQAGDGQDTLTTIEPSEKILGLMAMFGSKHK